jgi:hypothetical protein
MKRLKIALTISLVVGGGFALRAFDPSILPSAIALTAPGPTCSGSDTIEVLNQIIDEHFMNNERAQLKALSERSNPDAKDRPKVDDKFINIVTIERSARRASCKLDVEITYSGPDVLTGRDVPPMTKSFPATYTAELTDEDKLLITIFGLDLKSL